MSNYKGFNEWEQGVDVDNDDEFEEVNWKRLKKQLTFLN